MQPSDVGFNQSIAANYERWMVPNYFQPYAVHSAELISGWNPNTILEVGAGTGVLARELMAAVPTANILATDLNPAMVEVGRERSLPDSRVVWEVADVAALPSPSDSFDVVVAQFAVMFFPDRLAAYREMNRVLAPAGRLLMTTWGPVEGIPVDLAVENALQELYPEDPPSFIRRVPHGYHRPERIREDLIASGFRQISVDSLECSVQVPDARVLAAGLCTGTPIRTEILARSPDALADVVDHVSAALRSRFGDGPIINQMSALVITAQN